MPPTGKETGKGGGGFGENGTDLRGSNGKRLKKGEKKPASGSSQENQAASSRKKKRKKTDARPPLPYMAQLTPPAAGPLSKLQLRGARSLCLCLCGASGVHSAFAAQPGVGGTSRGHE